MSKSIYWFGILAYTYVQLSIGVIGAIAFSVAMVTQYLLPSPVYIAFMVATVLLWGLFHIAVLGTFVNE